MNKKNIIFIVLSIMILSSFNGIKSNSVSTKRVEYKSESVQATVETTDIKNGKFDIIVNNVPSNIVSVQTPTWSEKNGQDDLKWYTATKQSDGSYKVTVSLKNHEYDKGVYNIHVYLKDSSGKQTIFASTKVVSINNGNTKISNTKDTTVNLTLENSDYIEDKIMFAVWSEKGGQDDLIWYTATKENGIATYNVPIKNHKTAGTYNVHTYVYDSKNRPIYLSKEVFEISSPKAKITTSFDENTNMLKMTVSNIESLSDVEKVQIPTWSEINGQDDLIWYNATKQNDGTYTVETSISNHKFSKGIYISHVYITTSNGVTAIAADTTTNVIPTKVFTTSVNGDQSKFTINYANYDAYKGGQLLFAVWSEKGGQDDIVWYNATNGSYTGLFSNHLNKSNVPDSGIYNVHLWVNQKGKMTYVDSTTFTIDSPQSIDIKIGELQNGKFDVIVKNVPSNTTSVLIPVWSDINWQDDLVWYTATKQSDGSYKATISAKNHKYDNGLYNVHVYIKTSNNKTIAFGRSTNVSLNRGTITVNNIQDNNVSITLANSDYTENKVHFAVWSDKNWQDDLVWYTATKTNGVATYTVPIVNHKTSGKYYVHAYTYDAKNNPIYIGAEEFNIEQITVENMEIINTDVTDENGNGIYQVKVSGINSNSGVSSVKVPVWSASNQSDIYWYTATRQADGSYIATIYPKNHKYHSGTYHTHVYVYGNNGVSNAWALDDISINLTAKIRVDRINDGSGRSLGKYQVTITNISTDASIVYAATWTEANGQDDIIWYVASRQSDGSYKAVVKAVNHKPWGLTNTHIWATENGVQKYKGAIQYNTEKYQYTPVYYGQNDSRWRNVKFGLNTMGKTGCVPTALAMAFQGILNKTVTPVDVGNYLYNKTSEFNKSLAGASGYAVQLSSNYYGVNWKGLTTLNQINNALDSGAIVIAFVGTGNFVSTPGATHAIVLYSYSSGNTRVYDPLTSSKNGLYATSTIFNQQSRLAYDLRGGYVFYSLY